MKKLMMLAAASAALAASAAVTITDVSARQRWPWNGLVDIDFTIAGAAAGETFAIDVNAEYAGGDKKIAAYTYATEPVAGNGDNHIVWDLGADYPNFRAEDLRISVAATPISSDKTIYMVIDLSGGSTATKYPVRYTTQAPAHVQGAANEPCQTTELWMRRIIAPDFAFTVNSYAVVADNATTSQKRNFWGKMTKDYYVGIFELTQKQYQLVMGNWPNSWFTNEQYRASRPVEALRFDSLTGTLYNPQISPSSITTASFLGKLRSKTGLPINLPTNIQLNFAHRGGTRLTSTGEFYRYYINGSQATTTSISRYTATVENASPERDCDANSGTAYVGSYLPNEYGLYDAIGNVCEYTCEYTVAATSSFRDYYQMAASDDTLGNTKANPVVDPLGVSYEYRYNNNTCYRFARAGSWDEGSDWQGVWMVITIDSSYSDGGTKLKHVGFRLSMTVE